MEEEVWKDINGFEGYYQVSNIGRVRSVDRIDSLNRLHKSRLTTIYDNGKGYKRVSLYKESNNYYRYVHRLVAEVFIDNPDNKTDVNHIDGDKSNNNYTNLSWVTKKENIQHAVKNELIKTGEKSKAAKLSEEDVKYIREYYDPKNKKFNANSLSNKFNVSYWQIIKVAHGQRRA
ncbi:NUMOD4 motif-containing HNH endonuclease [Neobacillus vireti]|uniref:NUMOD4 motif-containing HNH endonuclease n=1 Tax=Neobacillus vireti TaxID=220686 RepID=UPI002FFEB3FE